MTVKGNKEVLECLNEVLTGELTAINQYFLHSAMCKDWGYNRLAETIYKESIDEMKHAQKLVDRILFLEGLPNLQKLDKLNIGQTVPEMMKADLDFEDHALKRLRKGIKVCMEQADHTTRELFEHILADEEHHVDWLESQIKLMDDMGVENYLAQQMHDGE